MSDLSNPRIVELSDGTFVNLNHVRSFQYVAIWWGLTFSNGEYLAIRKEEDILTLQNALRKFAA